MFHWRSPLLSVCLFVFFLSLSLSLSSGVASADESQPARPNLVFAIADDWGWPHAGVYGDKVVRTPTFDRLAREGVLFEQAFVSSPSCTPSRGAILAGQYHWRLEENANLWSTLPAKFPLYTDLLRDAGYHVGSWRKAWGPGKYDAAGRTSPPGGKPYKSLPAFLDARPDGAPFCFWFGSSDPHRPYQKGTGQKAGFDVDAVHVPAFYPNVEEIRGDITDYYFEVERFDREVGEMLDELERRGLLDNTILVVTSDHGMPFPRCKGNLYDWGVRVPLVVWSPGKFAGGRRVTDLVSLSDVAPTFLEAAGVDAPEQMTGRSLLPTLQSDKSGRVQADWNTVLYGRERHTPAQAAPSYDGYPSRALRTDDFLYIINFEPDRWPAGVPDGSTKGWRFADCDGGPTKDFLLENEGRPELRRYFDLCFAQRPAEELYDLKEGYEQVNNVADHPDYAERKQKLREQLLQQLRAAADPRVIGGGEKFDKYPYYGALETK